MMNEYFSPIEQLFRAGGEHDLSVLYVSLVT